MTGIKDLCYEKCKELLDAEFRLVTAGPDDQTEMVLQLKKVELQQAGYDPERSSRVPFAMIFAGPAEHELSQQIYHLENPQTGSMDIFLVPIGPEGESILYEAVFN